MTPIIINDDVRQQIFQVVQHAWNNIVPIYQMAEHGKLKEGMSNPIANDKGHYILIPQAFNVIFSIEDQGTEVKDGRGGLGKCRHLSMSINKKGRVPNPIALDMVMEEFGFDNPLHHCAIWIEHFGDDNLVAINVLEPLDGWPDEESVQTLETNCIKMFKPLFGDGLIQAIKNRREVLRTTDDELGTHTIEGGRVDENVASE